MFSFWDFSNRFTCTWIDFYLFESHFRARTICTMRKLIYLFESVVFQLQIAHCILDAKWWNWTILFQILWNELRYRCFVYSPSLPHEFIRVAVTMTVSYAFSLHPHNNPFNSIFSNTSNTTKCVGLLQNACNSHVLINTIRLLCDAT